MITWQVWFFSGCYRCHAVLMNNACGDHLLHHAQLFEFCFGAQRIALSNSRNLVFGQFWCTPTADCVCLEAFAGLSPCRSPPLIDTKALHMSSVLALSLGAIIHQV